MATRNEYNKKVAGSIEVVQKDLPTKSQKVQSGEVAQSAEHSMKTLPAVVAVSVDKNNSKTDVVLEVDPSEIEESEYANRMSDDFTSAEFNELKKDILLAGGNVQPIKVMRLAEPHDGIKYKLIFGHRRFRAVKTLLSEGHAHVRLRTLIVQPMGDTALFVEMDRENRARADLRPYEQGCMYKKALDKKLFPSQLKLAESLGVDEGNVSKAIKIAELDTDVLNSFRSPLAIQYRWGVALTKALSNKESEARLLKAAKEFSLMPKEAKPADKQIFQALIAAASPVEPKKKPEPELVEHTTDVNGVSFRISRVAVTPEQIQKISKYIESILAEGPPAG